ncbi:DUF2399 domain-containing protein [Kitasatospora sp. NPDC058965]|uniref:DUF2399 domain-containing protein n=1 Tax=Kitasatospora sp. NPDC058965 TaxID=3346682 RepID=UPI0036BF1B72
MNDCTVCPGACEGARLEQLTAPELAWLWEKVADRADRDGDCDLTTGRLTVDVPTDPLKASAAGLLLSKRPAIGGTSCRCDLAHLTAMLRTHGPRLTPAAVAAHALGRRLGVETMARRATRRRTQDITEQLTDLLDRLPPTARVRPDPKQAVEILRAKRWVHRLAHDPEGPDLAVLAVETLAALPAAGRRIDRRLLAQQLTGTPKALDRGSILAGLVLALATADSPGDPGDNRGAWDLIGVDLDGLTGGLTSLQMWPAGYTVPPHDPLTLTPHVLARCTWPASPAPDSWVFVTENPSVTTAVLDQAPLPPHARVLCTNGTPSALEVAAIARLAEAGWRIAARADFDAAGLRHVSALTAAHPGIVPWRMAADDYQDAVVASARARWAPRVQPNELTATPWDPALAETMRRRELPGYEEALLRLLVGDVLAGHPPTAPDPSPVGPGSGSKVIHPSGIQPPT